MSPGIISPIGPIRPYRPYPTLSALSAYAAIWNSSPATLFFKGDFPKWFPEPEIAAKLSWYREIAHGCMMYIYLYIYMFLFLFIYYACNLLYV